MSKINDLNVPSSAAVVIVASNPSFLTSEESDRLARAIAGDTVAFENLVMPHRDSILRIVQRILHNREDAEDAVQAAFLHALRHINSFQGHSRFSSWLTRIAINAALMRLRTSRGNRETSIDEIVERDEFHRTLDLADTRPNPEQRCAEKEIRAVFDKAIGQLSSDHVRVLNMRFKEEMSIDEVARILKVPTGTVKARLHRARVALSRHVHSRLASRPRALKYQRLHLHQAVRIGLAQ